MKVALLAACLLAAGMPSRAQEPATDGMPVPSATAPADRTPGYGTVESVWVLHRPAEPSASAGGSSPSKRAPEREFYRLRVMLDDGRVQYRDIAKPDITVGDRVLLTNAGDVVPD